MFFWKIKKGAKLLNIMYEMQTKFVGAGGGSRTHMKLPPMDFESIASAIPPHQHA